MKNANQIVEEIENTFHNLVMPSRPYLSRQEVNLYLGYEEYDELLADPQVGQCLAMEEYVHGIKAIRVAVDNHFHLALNDPDRVGAAKHFVRDAAPEEV